MRSDDLVDVGSDGRRLAGVVVIGALGSATAADLATASLTSLALSLTSSGCRWNDEVSVLKLREPMRHPSGERDR